MSRTRRILQGAFFSGGAVFISMLALLAVGKMVTNSFTTAEVGIFMVLLLAADFFNIANNFGVWVALPKLVAAANEEARPAIIRSAMSVQALISVALGSVVLAVWWWSPSLAGPLGQADWAAVQPYLWILPPLFLVGTLRDNAMAALAGLNLYGRRAVGIVTASLTQVILVFVLIWLGGGTLSALLWAMLASYGFALILLYGALPVGKGLNLDWKTYSESVKFSRPLYANSLLNFFFQRFDTVLVFAMLGAPTGGVYEMAKRFPTLLSRTLGALRVPFLPNVSKQISRGDEEGAARLVNRALILTAFVGNVGVLFTVLLQEHLIVLLFNADYLAATSVLGLLMGAICLAVQAGLLGETLIALGRPGIVTIANIGLAGITICVSLMLLGSMGIQGAGIGWLCGVSLSTVVQFYAVAKNGIRLDLRRFVKIQVAMALAALLIVLGDAGLAYRVGGLLGFVALCFGTGVLSVREIKELIGALIPEANRR
jgi:O-antigen/teichoic acid export membrane protein